MVALYISFSLLGWIVVAEGNRGMTRPRYWPSLDGDEIMRCRSSGREVQVTNVKIMHASWSCEGRWLDGTKAGEFMWYELEPLADGPNSSSGYHIL